MLCRQMIGGWLRTWQEYVPSSYDGSEPVPLVLAVHGAAHHVADSNTAWQLIAEREKFIVVYPHSLIEEIKFNVWESYTEKDGMPDDVAYFDELIDIIEKKYKIDPTRIYIQGQSVGDNMTSTYLFAHGDRIAAAAPLSGPASSSVFVSPETGQIYRRPRYPVPVIRTHGSEDTPQPLGSLGKICIMNPHGDPPPEVTEEARRNKWVVGQKLHIDLWREVNQCRPMPRLGLNGRYNWFIYDGDPCDFIFYTVEGGEHSPYLDMADNIWSSFFSAYRRVDGKIVRTEPKRRIDPDKGAIAVTAGSRFAYVDNQKVLLDEKGNPALVIEDHFYVPVKFLEKAFPDVSVELYEEGMAARICRGEDRLQVAMGNRAVIWNQRILDMPRTWWQDGVLYVPISEMASLFAGYRGAEGWDVCYLNLTGGFMSYDFAYVIRELLETEPVVSPAECVALEMKLRKRAGQQYAAHNVGTDKYHGSSEEIFCQLKAVYEKQVEEYRREHPEERT